MVSCGLDVDERPDRELLIDVLGEVSRVESEHEATPTDRVVEIDDEALVTGCVARGCNGPDARGNVDITLGKLPIDRWVVEVDAEDSLALRRGVIGETELELLALGVDWHASGE